MQELIDVLFDEEIYRLPGQTIVVIPTAWDALTDEDVALLSKIMAAVKLNLDKIRVISSENFTVSDLVSSKPCRIIAFGATVEPSLSSYQLTSIEGHSVIQADALGELNDQTKKDLWKELKNMFTTP